MNTEFLPITKVFPNIGQIKGVNKNPRFIRDEKYKKLVQSIKDDPEMLELRELIVYDTDNEDTGYVVIGGNMRYRAMKELGYKEVPCKVLHPGFPVDKMRRIVLKDNSGFGEWDFEALVDEWAIEEIDLAAIDIPDLGEALEDEHKEEPKPQEESTVREDDDFEETDVTQDDVIQEGDLWKLGRHTLLCGDSTKRENILRLFPSGEHCQLYLTDAPYNVSYGFEGSIRAKKGDGLLVLNDQQDNESFLQFLTDAYGVAKEFMDAGASFYLFHSDSYSYYFRQALINIGLELRENLIWNKNSLVLGRQDYHWKHEPILYGWKEGASHNWYSDRKQSTVIDWDRPTKSVEHPCLDPTTLVMTQQGYMRIGDITKGMNVLSADGEFHEVELTSSHPYNEPIYNIYVEGTNLHDRATHNHPYLVARRKKDKTFDIGFVEAEKLNVGDYILTPQLKHGTESAVSELDAWCYGLWLAQGSLYKSGHSDAYYPAFSLDIRKPELRMKLIEWGKDVKVSTYENQGNGITVAVFDAEKGKRCIELCGRHAESKVIAAEVFSWNKELRSAFFEGYMAGDGCKISTRWHRHSKSVSISLASQMKFLSESLGYRTCFYHCLAPQGKGIGDRKFKNTKDFYACDYHDKQRTFEERPIEYEGVKYWLRKVKEIVTEPYNGDVVNLSVEGNHTFQTVCGMTHNTMKPVGLIGYLMKNSSKKDDIVLDSFGGSGTTLIAAEQLGRKCRMAELSPHYCKVIIFRYIKLRKNYADVFRINEDGSQTSILELFDKEELDALCAE